MAKHLIITVDDMGLPGVQSYAKEIGSLHAPKTPNLAALEAAGIRFTNFYVNPICSPTRSLFLTGQYGFRTGVGSNCGIGKAGPPHVGEATLPKALPGHHRAVIGKWHLGTKDNGGYASFGEMGGFQTWRAGIMANLLSWSPYWHSYWYWPKFTDGVFPPPKVGDTGRPPSKTNPTQPPGNDALNRNPFNYNTTVTVDEARSWLSGKNEDWILWLAFQAPHIPIHLPPTAAERAAVGLPPMYDPELESVIHSMENGNPPAGWENTSIEAAAYLATCEALDYEIGRLLSSQEIKPDEDTWIWFFSDNGQEALTVQIPFNPAHAKGTTYDLGTRVPFIVRGPGIVAEKGKTTFSLAHVTDIFRTICAIEGVNLKQKFPGKIFDGVNLQPVFQNVRRGGRSFVYVEKFYIWKDGLQANPVGGIADSALGLTNDPSGQALNFWDRSVIVPGWKLRSLFPSGPQSTIGDATFELYDMRKSSSQGLGSSMLDGLNDVIQAQECDVIEDARDAMEKIKTIEEDLLP